MDPAGSSRYLACPDCDALFPATHVGEGEVIECSRCGATLFHYHPNSIHRALAFTIAAAFLFLVSNFFPFMTLRAGYRESEMVFSQSVSGLEHQGYPFLGAAVAVFTLIAPSLIILGLTYLLLPLLSGRRWPGAIPLCRWIYRARRWNMLEVFLLGALVSLLKLGKLATLTLGISFWAYVGLIICLTAALSSIDYRELWTRLEHAER
ncbi:MAG TPA: paraquat-inducible protein A [Chthoniobacterales bacterium]